jgi:hypothetical protein
LYKYEMTGVWIEIFKKSCISLGVTFVLSSKKENCNKSRVELHEVSCPL